MSDILELHLPPKPEYLPVVRAAVGVIAGGMSFPYDEIMHLRVAVSEAFDLAVRRTNWESPNSAPSMLAISFTVAPERLEIVVSVSHDGVTTTATVEDEEGLALIKGLMDDIQVSSGTLGVPLIRMSKGRPNIEN